MNIKNIPPKLLLVIPTINLKSYDFHKYAFWILRTPQEIGSDKKFDMVLKPIDSSELSRR